MLIFVEHMQIFYSLPGIFAVTPDSELTIALALTNWTIILTTGTFYQNNCLIVSLVSSPVTRVVAARTLQRIPGNVGVFNAEELSSGASSGEIVNIYDRLQPCTHLGSGTRNLPSGQVISQPS